MNALNRHYHKIFIILIFVISTIQAQGNYNKHYLPSQEVDRPLTLPQRQSGITVGYLQIWEFPNDEFKVPVYDSTAGEWIYGSSDSPAEFEHFLQLPSYQFGITNNLQLNADLGFPSIEFQLFHNYEIILDTLRIAKPQISIGIGYNSRFSQNYKHLTFYSLGKYPISDKIWGEHSLSNTALLGDTIKNEYSVALGLQLNSRISVIPQYELYQNIYKEDRIIVTSSFQNGMIVPIDTTTLPSSEFSHVLSTTLDFHFLSFMKMALNAGYMISKDEFLESTTNGLRILFLLQANW